MEQAEVRREMYEGFGDTMTRAFEFVIIPLLFGFLGYLLDGRIGTRPLFMLIFGAVGALGCGLRAFYAYRYRIAQAEKDMPWNR